MCESFGSFVIGENKGRSRKKRQQKQVPGEDINH